MSSRQLKKLRAQEERNVAEKTATGDASSGEESDDVVVSRPRAKNPFSAFAALEDEGNDDNSDSEDNDNNDENGGDDKKDISDTKNSATEKKEEDNALETREDVDQAAESTTTTKKKKKNKSKKKKKPKEKEKSADVEDKAQDDGLDEIDRAMKELGVETQKQAPDSNQSHANLEEIPDPIKINLQGLKVLNELRDIFGGDTIRAAQTEDEGAAQRPAGDPVEGNPGMVMVDLETFLRADPVPANMARRGVHGGAGRERTDALAKRNPFIQFKDTWPRATSGGLGMKQLTSPAEAAATGIVEYTFEHNPAYVKLEVSFFGIVLMHNHQPMIHFLKQHPYHISSLIQVSRIAKQNQDGPLAGDLCERALFSFGRSTLSSFRQKLSEGKARLSFRRPENRQFALAGLYYIQSLIPRGTFRTALEWTKLFLSLMPEDEYSFLLYLPIFALRAYEGKWLIEALNPPGDTPAMLEDAVTSTPMWEYIYVSLGLAYLQVKDNDTAAKHTAIHMMRLPWLFGALFQALNMDVPRVLWGISPRDEHENLYTQLYIHLMKDLWGEADAKALLLKAVERVTRKPDIAAIDRVVPVSLRIARFVYLDDTPAIMALVPDGMLHVMPNYGFDPLPPPNETNIFSNDAQQLPWISSRSENEGVFGDALQIHPLFRNHLGLNDVEVEDPDDDSDASSEQEEEVVDQVADRGADQPTQPAASGQPSGMPGTWVEDVEDEEYAQ